MPHTTKPTQTQARRANEIVSRMQILGFGASSHREPLEMDYNLHGEITVRAAKEGQLRRLESILEGWGVDVWSVKELSDGTWLLKAEA